MRTIEPVLTPDLRGHVGDLPVWRAAPFGAPSYRALVQHVARLSYANPNLLLFFRGQDKDFQSKAGGSTLYPAIYREDKLQRRELEYRFQRLESAARILAARFAHEKVEGHRDVARKKYIQWSILQHYEVVSTPLLDVTHSLRVACSFAQYASTDATCYVYALGLPFTANRIAIDSEEDIANVRLLSICPPEALRPFFQEGYMVGTPDVTVDFESKTELDFRNRLVAKFAIPRAASRFWGSSFQALAKSDLYPAGDRIQELCAGIAKEVETSQHPPGRLGEFILDWSRLERQVLERARHLLERNVSVTEAVNVVGRRDELPERTVRELHALRQLRNTAVHTPDQITEDALAGAIRRVRDVSRLVPTPK